MGTWETSINRQLVHWPQQNICADHNKPMCWVYGIWYISYPTRNYWIQTKFDVAHKWYSSSQTLCIWLITVVWYNILYWLRQWFTQKKSKIQHNYLPKFSILASMFVWRFVCLSVCLFVGLSYDTGRNVRAIKTKLGTYMYLGSG